MTPSFRENFRNSPCVGILANPLSGRNRKNPEFISAVTDRNPEILLRNVQTPEDINTALMEFGTLNIDILVISGGDGTVQAVLTDLFCHTPFAKQPQIMVLAGGTTNMIAADIGVLGNQEQAINRLSQWIKTGHGTVSKKQRAIIRLLVPGHELKYGMFFGTGSISQGTAYYHRNLHSKKLSGFPGICMTVIRFLWAFLFQHNQFATPTPITLHLNNHQFPKEDFMLLFVSTLDRLLFGLKPFWGTESGKLKITAVKSKTRYLLQVLPFLARGRKPGKGTEENGYLSHNADEIHLFLAESVVLDGEMYTPVSDEQPTILQHGGDITFLRIEA